VLAAVADGVDDGIAGDDDGALGHDVADRDERRQPGSRSGATSGRLRWVSAQVGWPISRATRSTEAMCEITGSP
jgi:hypothetical protein